MRLAFVFALILVASSVQAEGWRVVNENLITSDSDDADQRRHLVGMVSGLPHFGGDAGVWLGTLSFDEPIGSEDFKVLRLTYDKEMSSQLGITSRLYVIDGDDWSPLLGDLTAVYKLNEQWRFEGAVEKGWIDSVSGLRQELGSDTYSISADWRMTDQWTAVAALLTMSNDDGNQRDGGVFRLIYSVPQVPGLNIQTRSKIIKSDFNGVGYFSPPELQEHLFLFGYSRAAFADRWVFSVLAGAGNQKIEPEFGDKVKNDLYYLELKSRGWFSDHAGLEAKGYCTNTGGPNFGTPDDSYRYCSLLFSLIASF